MRGLIKAGHTVKVVLTSGALTFLKKDLFTYLGAAGVFTTHDELTPQNPNEILHIQLARFCERLIIAPASANTIATLARGHATDLLSSIFLAMDQKTPIILYPAMNTKMLTHPFTVENFKKLRTLPQLLIAPTANGELACQEQGEGKLLEIESIIDMAPFVSPSKPTKKILITTGATNNPLDPIRYLTNSSSGLTGFYLARQAISLGYQVTVIAGQNATSRLASLIWPDKCNVIRVSSTSDMYKAVSQYFPSTDIYISSAAIGDIEFDYQKTKIKKQEMKMSLPYLLSTDILKEVLKIRKKGQTIIGFAAETELSSEVLLKKWNSKPVDLLIGTHVHNGLSDKGPPLGFKKEDAYYCFVKNGKVIFKENLSKEDLAKKILGWNYD